MKNKAQLIAALVASLSLASLGSAQTTLYLNSAQATTNSALATANSWWTDAAGTTAFAGTVSTTTNILAFNSLVPGAYTQRTGGGAAGTISISGFQVLNPGGAITVTTASNQTQTVTLNGAVGIDLSAATQNFTYRAGSDTDPARTAFLRIATAAPATTAWKVNTGTTLTIGSTTRNTNNIPNTSITAQSAGKTLQLTGNGTTAMGNIVFHANVGSNALALTINGTGTSSSGGNVAFNGVTNTLGSLSLTNATATFASGGTTSGTVTVNSGGVLAGTGTLSGAVTVNGALRPNTAPVNTTARFNFSSTLALGSSATTTFDVDVANYTGVTSTGGTTFNGALAINLVNTLSEGAYSYNLFDFGSQSGRFTSVGITSLGSLTRDGAIDGSGTWSGAFGSNTFQFTESDGILGITVSAIPEPSTWATLAGLSGLAFAAGRRRRRAV